MPYLGISSGLTKTILSQVRKEDKYFGTRVSLVSISHFGNGLFGRTFEASGGVHWE